MFNVERHTRVRASTMRRVPVGLLVAVTLAAVASTPGGALAHKMDVLAKAGHPDPAAVYVEAGYEYGDPAPDATVTLTNETGAEVARGTTDERGVCSLPRPPAGTYTVTVDDGAGHRESLTLPVPMSESEIAAVESAKRNRWLASAGGLAAIAGLTLTARRVARKPKPAA